MKLKVTYDDAEPIRIERMPSLTENYVAFEMVGSTAVWQEGDVADLSEVVEQVENLPFVNAVKVGE